MSEFAVPARIDRAAMVGPTPAEHALLRQMMEAYDRLKALGWNDAMYAPKGVNLHVIEVGSTGIHKAYRDDERRFWVYDGDEWPSTPCLYRIEAVAQATATGPESAAGEPAQASAGASRHKACPYPAQEPEEPGRMSAQTKEE